MFKPIKDIIGISINRHGLKSQVDALDVFSKYKKVAREVFGDEATENLVPRSFKDGVLRVDARGASWASTFHINKMKVMAKLPMVKQIDVRIAN